MRLNKIKLAGFKSFVDPTTVVLPTPLTGVVGPNGCGKSNIIDAVRWVMGEISAKHLRGESMADVIFSGSSSRKPVGQASIELVFDNSDGSAGGQYANYNEISVKRQVSRDGTSNYFLNGTRCRRRDIMDVFLGTGLGPRSYAIIEQGMISRFIEAKPEDLRLFLEEAAGISKYKERRKETENRIRHTRDNLDRINDVRQELEKQLQHLQRQAKTAEKFKELKQEERQTKAELLALRRRDLDRQAQTRRAAISEQETGYQARVADLRALEAKSEKAREQHVEATDELSRIQGEFYRLGGDIAGIEQGIQLGKEKREQLQLDQRQVDEAAAAAEQTLEADRKQLATLRDTLAVTEPAWREAQAAEEASQTALDEAEAAMQDWQLEWEDFNQRAATSARTMEVEQTRISHLEQQRTQLAARLDRYRDEHAGLSTDELDQEIEALQRDLHAVDARAEGLADDIEACQHAIHAQRQNNEQSAQQLDAKRGELQTRQGRLASLEALQEAALGKRERAVAQWLSQHGLDDRQRLAEVLQVDERWERAIETVLGYNLQAIGVDDLAAPNLDLAGLEQGSLTLLQGSAPAAAAAQRDLAEPLLGKVRSPWSVEALLAGVYAADGLEQAMDLRARLQAHESVVTPDGVWLGPNWMRVARPADENAGILHREHELKETARLIEGLRVAISELEGRLDAGRADLHDLEDKRNGLQAERDGVQRQHADLKSALRAKETALDQMRSRSERIRVETDELERQIDREANALGDAALRLEQAEQQVNELAQARAALERRRGELRARLDEARERAHDDHDTAHQHALRIESVRAELNSTEQAVGRLENQLRELHGRRDALAKALQDSHAPLRELEQNLKTKLAERLEVENALNGARSQVQDIEHQLRQVSEQTTHAEQRVQEARTELERLRMEFEGVRVRLQTIDEQIGESGFTLEALAEALPPEASEAEWHDKVEKLDRRIQRLGPINLAAIDEFKEQSERKTYLDSQFEDLTEALTTLENAIRKIDRETRTRFKETFDKVNDGLKRMFPRLFGGGHACLELSGEDLLDAGVSILARPPGKRIGSIHLMSGGEKALTAIAMVFAIFELKPAPFCLLDEVDAPLDDANVGRFCELVREMSERVQFIFITHNKVTMELANQLTGVTMHEPGVSRLVAVDVDEAAAMAAG